MVDESDSVQTVGERLRAAREAQGLSLEEVASRTRIPTRHLDSLEQSEWSRLPAPTYSIGFAKAYASVVGLDRTQIEPRYLGNVLVSKSLDITKADHFFVFQGERIDGRFDEPDPFFFLKHF